MRNRRYLNPIMEIYKRHNPRQWQFMDGRDIDLIIKTIINISMSILRTHACVYILYYCRIKKKAQLHKAYREVTHEEYLATQITILISMIVEEPHETDRVRSQQIWEQFQLPQYLFVVTVLS